MKISFSFCSCLVFLAESANGQTSQPECFNWTSTVLDNNPNIEPAAVAFNDAIAGTLEANCLDDAGALKPCDIGFGPSNVGDNYTRECNAGNGSMWVYRYSPLCDNDVSQNVDGVLVCASKRCNAAGVSNLVPDPVFLEPFDAYNYTCGTGVSDLRKSSGAYAMSMLSVGALVGMVSAYIAM